MLVNQKKKYCTGQIYDEAESKRCMTVQSTAKINIKRFYGSSTTVGLKKGTVSLSLHDTVRKTLKRQFYEFLWEEKTIFNY